MLDQAHPCCCCCCCMFGWKERVHSCLAAGMRGGFVVVCDRFRDPASMPMHVAGRHPPTRAPARPSSTSAGFGPRPRPRGALIAGLGAMLLSLATMQAGTGNVIMRVRRAHPARHDRAPSASCGCAPPMPGLCASAHCQLEFTRALRLPTNERPRRYCMSGRSAALAILHSLTAPTRSRDGPP